eukprot:TRINITY_DN2455_c0_g3_i1.p2 TRINITY_DN2455_c0_g3~~TRINITY_DN2455_c0_g3_i1.p2  ORF type:complete len:183 (-),score=9.08 TRINITY_DN2455_c0_g3_i1:247-795(-)
MAIIRIFNDFHYYQLPECLYTILYRKQAKRVNDVCWYGNFSIYNATQRDSCMRILKWEFMQEVLVRFKVERAMKVGQWQFWQSLVNFSMEFYFCSGDKYRKWEVELLVIMVFRYVFSERFFCSGINKRSGKINKNFIFATGINVGSGKSNYQFLWFLGMYFRKNFSVVGLIKEVVRQMESGI